MEERDGAEIEGFGIKAKIKGVAWTSQGLAIMFIVVSCTGFLYWERTQTNRSFIDQHAVTQAQNITTQKMLASVIETQIEQTREISESAQIQAYVLSLPQSQRERLNLSMPSTLRMRIRQGSQ